MKLVRALLLSSLALAGCDKITGAADQKISDAEAIGYACRVSLKKPEDCMKENESHSTTSLLAGWKTADKEILEHVLDPSMGQDPATAAHPQPASAVPEKDKPAAKGEEEASAEKEAPAKSAKSH